MIITFNNNSTEGKYLPFFDCSWISRYPDEDERVFVNGFLPIQVTCIRIMETNRNYTELFQCLLFFESILSSSDSAWIDGVEQAERNRMRIIEGLLVNEGIMKASEMTIWTHQESKTRNELIVSGYTDDEASTAIFESSEHNVSSESYVSSMFKAYIRQKKHITIMLYVLEGIRTNSTELSVSKILSMIIEGSRIERNADKCEGGMVSSRINLLSSNVFKLAPNAESITIETSGYSSNACYTFNLLYFLENISSNHRWQQIKILNRCRYKTKTESWIFYVWKASHLKIIECYQRKQLDIQYHTEDNSAWYFEYILINRKMQ